MWWAGHVARIGEERKSYNVFVGNTKERDRSEDRGVDGRMVSKLILGRLGAGIEWIQLAQDIDRWRALLNTAMNLRVLAPRI
jgi:hypothetical protein